MKWFTIIGVVMLALVLFRPTVSAQTDTFQLNWFTFGGGGGVSSGGVYSISGIASQVSAEEVGGGIYGIYGGFQPAVVTPQSQTYLPLILKN